MKLNNLSIGKRLALVLGLILSLSLASSLFAVFQLRKLDAEMDAMIERDLRTERAGADWMRLTTAGVQRSTAIAKSKDPALLGYFSTASADAVRQTTELQKLVEAQIDEPQEREVFDKISVLRKEYLSSRDEVYKLKAAGDVDGANHVFASRFEPTAGSYVGAVQQLVDMQRAQLDAAAARSEAVRARTSQMLVASTLLSLALGALVAWLLARSITRPLRQAVSVAQEVASGNLAVRIESEGRDEPAQLLQALGTMNASLVRLVGEVRQGTDTIATASGQIASGNQDLSSRTEQQASSLQETAASMQHLTQTVKRNADNARQASELAQSASQLARQGGTVVAQVVETMGSIQASSRRVADIIGVIDGIAFQTNILALNAAVEAARAGEQGRGFAVVAGEVRNLAQRSADAAKEIKALIEESVGTVGTGHQLVDQAGRTMAEIVDGVKRVSDIIAGITTASQEQSAGIEQVNLAITQMDQVTQQNAALVEEASAAAGSLKQQAQGLVQAVEVFRLTA
jgi:methyl-accepting chemotaxis protein